MVDKNTSPDQSPMTSTPTNTTIPSHTTIKEQDLTILSEIDRGGEGIVKEGQYKNTKVVIKTLHKSDYYDVKEIEVYTKLQHSSMVKFHGYFIDKYDNINLVLDFAEGESLDLIIQTDSLSYKQKLDVIFKISSFLLYLRENHAIHRDLKPQNIKVKIMSEEEVDLKVLDFGITKICKHTLDSTRSNVGTLAYAPPEIFCIEENSDINERIRISYKYDIWSLGMITSYLFSGVFPWKSQKSTLNNHLMFVEVQLIKKKKFLVPESLDADVRRLVELCTGVNPNDRLNPSSVVALLRMIKNGDGIVGFDVNEDNFK